MAQFTTLPITKSPFTAFPFAATGGTATRTAPDRAQDRVNVLDYGALGNNSNNDRPGIQAAINAASARGYHASGAEFGALVEFPPGIYLTDDPLTFPNNASIGLIGSGHHSCSIIGNFPDFIIKKPDNGMQNLERIQGLLIKNNLNNAAAGAILADNMSQGLIEDCFIQGFTGVQMTQNIYNARIANCIITCSIGGGITSGTKGLMISQVLVEACRLEAWDVGIQAFNVGPSIINCSCESSNAGIIIGRDVSNASSNCAAFSIINFQTENIGKGIDIYNGHGGLIAACALTATGLGTVTPLYGMRCRTVDSCVFMGIPVSSSATIAGIDLTYGNQDSASNNVMIGVTAGPGGWIAPGANNRSAWRFINCNYPYDAIMFSELPGQSGVTGAPTAYEGMEFNISNGTIADSAPAGNKFGGIVTNGGGGGTHCKVRYNGTDWTAMGT